MRRGLSTQYTLVSLKSETLGEVTYQEPQVKSGYLKEKDIKPPSFCVPDAPGKDTFSFSH